MTKKTAQLSLIIIPIVVFIAILGFVFYKQSLTKPVKKAKASIETITVKPQTHQDKLSALGHVESSQGVIIKANVSGRITKVSATSGQAVKKGDVLLEINPESIQADLESNKAQTSLDKVNLERAQALYKKNAASKEDLDTAKATYEKDLAQRKSILAQLHDAVIRAPFDGTMGIVRPKLGQYVNVGDNLLSLQTLTPIYVNFSLPSQYQSKVKKAQVVELNLDAYPKQTFTGKVTAIDNMINPSTNSISIRSTFQNEAHKLLPGDLGNVSLITDTQKNAMILPSPAIVYNDGKSYVYKIINDKAQQQEVTLGAQVGQDDVIITKGVSAGDVIATAGASKLSNGMTVVVKK
ncbi:MULTISPECIES: efflux RND transporter periplasmic adaptor subunit [Cysteiniphilum]|uniref:efflux RND transporter periplasmic adaptor subunit n=1 Tax=Cysteiniphilum TaxID=2056696 RepID=UPI00178512D0|nr:MULTISPECIES: efflux RND transporter periplasmic adaptor subunit [Cysteiniphilum]